MNWSGVRAIGDRDVTPLSTPRENVEESSRSRPTTSTSAKPDRASRSNRRTRDIRQIVPDLDEDIHYLIASLVAVPNKRCCDWCGSDDHLIAGCPKVEAMASDATKVSRIIRTLQGILASRGGAQNSARPYAQSFRDSGARTPPLSNTTPIHALADTDTDDDTASEGMTIARVDSLETDESGSDQDFP